MTNLVYTYKNLTELEKHIFHRFHDDILRNGTCWTNIGVRTPNEKGALGSLVKKQLLVFQETDSEGYELYSSALIKEDSGNYTSII
jgi:hypothetical protein